jgi:hypothetical protein
LWSEASMDQKVRPYMKNKLKQWKHWGQSSSGRELA